MGHVCFKTFMGLNASQRVDLGIEGGSVPRCRRSFSRAVFSCRAFVCRHPHVGAVCCTQRFLVRCRRRESLRGLVLFICCCEGRALLILRLPYTLWCVFPAPSKIPTFFPVSG